MAKYVRRHLYESSKQLIRADDIKYDMEKKANYFCPCDTCYCIYRYRAATASRGAYFYQYGPEHDPSCTFARKEKSDE